MTTALHEAVRSGNLVRVRQILRSDPSCVNDRNEDYQTPLHLVYANVFWNTQAQYDERLPIMQTLLNYGANVNARDGVYEETPLILSVKNYQIKGVELLLQYGADPNVLNIFNNSALHYAKGEIINLLLKYGADLNVINCDGKRPLDLAFREGSLIDAKMLANAGAQARVILRSLFSPEYSDVKKQMQFLIQYGKLIDLDGRSSPKIMYYAGIRSANPKYIEKVLRLQNIDINNLTREGDEMTQLHNAVATTNEDQVRALLEAGADVNAKNVLCETPLHLLLRIVVPDKNLLFRVSALLIKAGADLQTRDYLEFTPLQLAVDKKYPEVVNLMLAKVTGIDESKFKHGFNPTVKLPLSYEFTRMLDPLAIAIHLGYEEAVDRLLGMRHHVEKTNDPNYCSPLYYALHSGHFIKMLLDAGYRIDGRYSHGVPLIRLFTFGYKVFEVISLMWEFNCICVLRKILIESIKIPFMGISLVIFYLESGLQSNKLNEEFTLLKKLLSSNTRLSPIFTSCDDQINNLKRDIVCGHSSKFDLLTMKLDSLVQFLNDEANFKACKKLRSSFEDNVEMESFERAIMVRLDLAFEKRRLLDSAKDSLNEAFQGVLEYVKLNSLPDEIMRNILSYLNIRELKKLSIEH